MSGNYKQVLGQAKNKIRRIDDATKDVLQDAAFKIVTRTPVDTGLARGNWRGRTTAPATGTFKTLDKSGRVTAGRIKAVIARMKIGQRLFITNNLPYMRRLENGWSKQAPAGFITLTLAELRLLFKRRIKVIF